MSNIAKMIRGQIRQEVKELLESELVRAVEERIMKVVLERLAKIDQKQQDLLGFVIRNTTLEEMMRKEAGHGKK
jgi:hypothetical protein